MSVSVAGSDDNRASQRDEGPRGRVDQFTSVAAIALHAGVRASVRTMLARGLVGAIKAGLLAVHRAAARAARAHRGGRTALAGGRAARADGRRRAGLAAAGR